jgi:hypothetical protein
MRALRGSPQSSRGSHLAAPPSSPACWFPRGAGPLFAASALGVHLRHGAVLGAEGGLSQHQVSVRREAVHI